MNSSVISESKLVKHKNIIAASGLLQYVEGFGKTMPSTNTCIVAL